MANGKSFRENSALLIAALICAGALPFLAAFAQSGKENKKELKAQAEALLAKSQGLSDIEAPGSPPFVLNAKIHFQIGAQSMDGQGQIIWLAPDHYREVYTAPNYSYTEIVRDGYRYIQRTKDELPPIIYELRTAVEHSFAIRKATKDKIKKITVTPSGSDTSTCITYTHGIMECLDNDADETVFETDWPQALAMTVRYELSGFATFGSRRFPQKIVFRGGDGDVIDVEVQRLAFIKDAPADAFQIPLHSAQETWCATPEYEQNALHFMNLPSDFNDATMELMKANASLYCVINSGGHVRAVYVLHSDRKVKDQVLQDWMSEARFPQLVCGKDGQEYEIEAYFSLGEVLEHRF